MTLRTHAQAPSLPLGDLESAKTQDETSTELPQSQEEQRPENFIPDGVALLPTLELGQEMGAERGGGPVIQ